MNEIPIVSIIMATYNRASYIFESLKSIQAQTFKDWECIIIDDGGTDNTKEIIIPILKKDSRFQFLKRPDNFLKGLPGCRNYGLDLAKGNYIVFFDDDDIAHPQNLELCVQELSNNNISFCRYIRDVFTGDFHNNFDFSKGYSHFNINVNDIERILKNELLFNSCAVMWKKECFANNRFVEHLMYAEEWELYSRIISNGFKGISIKKTLFYGRKHSESNTGEFYKKDQKRIASNANAIVLVIENLKNKNLLSKSIIRYFIQVSLDYKSYDLFNRIINTLKLSIFETLNWRLFYKHLPLRLYFYKYYKNHLKRK